MKHLDAGGANGSPAVSMSSARRRFRVPLTSSAAAVAFAAMIIPADAYYVYDPADLYLFPRPSYHSAPVKRAKKPKPAASEKGGLKPLKMPLIAISIARQHLTVYDAGVPVASAPVSTGVPGHSTPTGIFSVIQKQIFHRSNLYSAAPMPYMQRITWSGIALHAGVLPGHPASHGCIRMPYDFARKLYAVTRTGARVVITYNDIAPTEFESARLFVRKPSDTPVATTAAGASVATADAAFSAGAASAELGKSAQAAAAPIADALAPGSKQSDGSTGPALVRPIPVTASDPVDTPKSLVSPAPRQAEPALPTKPETAAPYGPERPLRPGPISVFISRKEGKLFVRKGFEPVFSAPVTIANPDVPLGTHVFTATELKPDGINFRWLVLSMPAEAPRRAEAHANRKRKAGNEHVVQPSSAAEALQRIEMPPDALARISALMSPGASLIVSDQGLGSETGLETDFIVLTR
jgi:lipoprotein-anchoring transpeptidase ErfK/SrfK